MANLVRSRLVLKYVQTLKLISIKHGLGAPSRVSEGGSSKIASLSLGSRRYVRHMHLCFFAPCALLFYVLLVFFGDETFLNNVIKTIRPKRIKSY